MAPGKRGRAGRSRSEDPRNARTARAEPDQVTRTRGGEGRVLDTRATRLVAADLLSRRPWTRAELTARLRRRGAPEDVAREIISDLSARGYLDDAVFARQWVDTRSARGYGATRLRVELRARGVAQELIDAALASIADETALDKARAVARRRLPALERRAVERASARLADYLMRRGYARGIAMRVVKELTGTRVEADPGD